MERNYSPISYLTFIGNTLGEIDYLLKSARASVQADNKIEGLNLLSNDRHNLENALNCYNKAMKAFPDDSVMKVAIIEEIKKIQPVCDATSNFSSPALRVHDLEKAAKNSIQQDDFVTALEKLNEIFDIILERKVEHLYEEVLKRFVYYTPLLCLLI